MATLGALVITALLTLGSIGVFGNSRELSTTAGDTVHIPCLFGEGTIRNIYWYYNDGTGPIKILTFFKGTVTVDAIYAYRATLHDDNSTLILSGITVNDEGTYRCDVDREGQTAVPNINTKLNVFSLTPDTLPEIAECTDADCIIYSNKSITITCALRNVYPVEDVKLIWYQDGQLVTSPNDLTLNDDGTIDLIRPIKVSDSGNFTCNASFLTTQGAENAAMSVAVWITPESENTPEKKLTSGQTAGIVVCALAVPLLVIALLIVRKRRKKSENTPLAESAATDHHEQTSLPEYKFRQRKKNKDANVSETVLLITSDSSTDLVEEPKLTLLASNFPVAKFHEFCFQLDRKYNDADGVLNKHSKDCKKALLEILIEWKNRTDGHRSVLQDALEKAGVGGLRGLIAGDKPETHPVQETTIEAILKDKQSSIIEGLEKTNEVESPSQNGNPEGNQGHHSPQEPLKNEDQLKGEGAESSKQGNNGKNHQDQDATGKQEGNVDRLHGRKMTDEEIIRLSKQLPVENYSQFCVALKIKFNESKGVLTKHQLNYPSAFEEILSKWKARTGGPIVDLDKALVTAEAGGIIALYKNQ